MCTYPLALLTRFPKLPPPNRIADLCQIFPKTCWQHVLFDKFPTSVLSRDFIAPLRFGIASLASVGDGGGTDETEALYMAGASLWPAMVEVDNSLARSVEMLLAVRPIAGRTFYERWKSLTQIDRLSSLFHVVCWQPRSRREQERPFFCIPP
jgi:hypothetical protein